MFPLGISTFPNMEYICRISISLFVSNHTIRLFCNCTKSKLPGLPKRKFNSLKKSKIFPSSINATPMCLKKDEIRASADFGKKYLPLTLFPGSTRCNAICDLIIKCKSFNANQIYNLRSSLEDFFWI